MKRFKRVLAGCLGGLATILGLLGSRRESLPQRWRLSLWALAVALIAGTAGGVRVAGAETIEPPEVSTSQDGDDAQGGLDALDLLAPEGPEQVEPEMVVSCYCTAAPPRRW